MTHAENITAMAAALFNYFGTSAVYVPNTGPRIDCTVIIEKRAEYQPIAYEAQAAGREITLEVRMSEIESVPVKDEFFIVGDYTYYVKSIVEEETDDTFAKMIVKEMETP